MTQDYSEIKALDRTSLPNNAVRTPPFTCNLHVCTLRSECFKAVGLLEQLFGSQYQASKPSVIPFFVNMAKSTLFLTLLVAVSTTLAALPEHKIRGVNIGSLFIVEPWMSSATWESIGCGSAKSEWDCVASLGQERADAAFQRHWDTFVGADDFDKMKKYGLNTVRIPVGHWFVEETIVPGEKWPREGMKYLDKIVGLAASRNIGVIIDLHGAPGVQVPNNAFTGHVSRPPCTIRSALNRTDVC